MPSIRHDDSESKRPFAVVRYQPADVKDAFGLLVDAFMASDFKAATRLRRELYRAGWSIVCPKGPSWRGGRS